MSTPLLYLLIAAMGAGVLWLLFWPERGLFWRWQRSRQITARVLREDALKHIEHGERHKHAATISSVAGALQITENQAASLLADMQTHDLLRLAGDQIYLTPAGREYALHVIRAHRLWERYLAEKTGYTEAEWHDQAHWREHMLSPADLDELAAQLDHPTYDPHGDPIPTASGDWVLLESQPITSLAADEQARIVHLEDEPPAVYAQLVAEGLHPGLEVRMLAQSPQRVRFWAGGDEHLLAPIVAANISVVPLPQDEVLEEICCDSLSSLKTGEEAQVVQISQAVRGLERRRFMDLGILPGTSIKAELTSPGGDPTAYRVRGALIALRREQADLIRVTRN